MKHVKERIQNIIGENNFQRLNNFRLQIKNMSLLVKNFCIDFILYYRHSNVFKKNTFNKIEALIILRYHSIEKGLLHNEIRPQFGIYNVKTLSKLLKRNDVVLNKNRTQISAAYTALCEYYELHVALNIDISDYFSKSDYNIFKGYSNANLKSVKKHQLSSYFENSDKNFFLFSNSRASVRDFTGEKIPFETLQKVIELAKNAPSVCNRQPVKVYYVDEKKIIDSILAIQQGLKGSSEVIEQLLVVVSDRNYFYSVGERNQLYIDGGIFLMNLLYALHYNKIAACPAHWGLDNDSDRKVNKLLNMSDSEKVICLVAIGIPKDEFNTTLSLRRSNDEILKRVNNDK